MKYLFRSLALLTLLLSASQPCFAQEEEPEIPFPLKEKKERPPAVFDYADAKLVLGFEIGAGVVSWAQSSTNVAVVDTAGDTTGFAGGDGRATAFGLPVTLQFLYREDRWTVGWSFGWHYMFLPSIPQGTADSLTIASNLRAVTISLTGSYAFLRTERFGLAAQLRIGGFFPGADFNTYPTSFMGHAAIGLPAEYKISARSSLVLTPLFEYHYQLQAEGDSRITRNVPSGNLRLGIRFDLF